MKQTNSNLSMIGKRETEAGNYFRFRFDFELFEEDLDLSMDCLDWVNDKSKEVWAKYGVTEPQDLADFLLACITNKIHELTEARTGKKFVLRMDRKLN